MATIDTVALLVLCLGYQGGCHVFKVAQRLTFPLEIGRLLCHQTTNERVHN